MLVIYSVGEIESSSWRRFILSVRVGSILICRRFVGSTHSDRGLRKPLGPCDQDTLGFALAPTLPASQYFGFGKPAPSVPDFASLRVHDADVPEVNSLSRDDCPTPACQGERARELAGCCVVGDFGAGWLSSD